MIDLLRDTISRLGKKQLIIGALLIIASIFLLLGWAVQAYAKYAENKEQVISLTVQDDENKITYSTIDVAHGNVPGKFYDSQTSRQINQAYDVRYAVPVKADGYTVDNPTPDDTTNYEFEYWYSYDSTNNIVTPYKDLNSKICSESNWPINNTFYAKYKLKLEIVFDATSGSFEDGTIKKAIAQEDGQAYKKPDTNPTWHVEGASSQPTFVYWYEITQSGQHVDWTATLASGTASLSTLPHNGVLYAEWTSDDFIVTFDAQESQGGYWDNGEGKVSMVLKKQEDGQPFNMPDDPSNSVSSKSFKCWNLNKNIDEEATRITSETIASKATHNHITVYAHYNDSRHRVTVIVANPESGGYITWKNDEGQDETGIETYYDAPDEISGEKLKYSMTSDYINDVLVGTAEFSRGGTTAKVFSSSNDATAVVFSRFDIIDEFGNFPGWEGAVNCDITIKLYFIPASYGAYWVANMDTQTRVVAGRSIPAGELQFYNDNLYDVVQDEVASDGGRNSKIKIPRENSSPYNPKTLPINPSSTSSQASLDWGYDLVSGSANLTKSKVTSCVIDPTFIDFPLRSTSHMFYNFQYITDFHNSISNINVFGVTSMAGMFWLAKYLPSIDLSKWDTRNVTTMERTFYGLDGKTGTTPLFVWVNLSNWSVSKCNNFKNMFGNCRYLEHIYVSSSSINWRQESLSQNPDSTDMFTTCSALHNHPTSWTTQYKSILYAYCQDEIVSPPPGGYFETWRGNT